MHTTKICHNHLNVELPLEYICESFKTHGVDASVLNQVLKFYEAYPKPTAIKSPHWSALEENILNPNCTLAALISVPFLMRNNPSFDPSATHLWPILVNIFNGCFPYRMPSGISPSLRTTINGMRENPTPQQNLHVCMLSAMLCCPLSKKTVERLNADVFSQWNGKQWQDLFNVFMQRTTSADFINDFKTISKNISQCTSNDLTDFWVQLACSAVANGNSDLSAKISQHFKKNIDRYLHENTQIALAPHLMHIQERSEGARDYKIWMVAFWIASHQPNVWKNESFCKIVLHKMCGFLGRLYRCAHSEEEEISSEFKEFKNSQECCVVENIFKCIDAQIVQAMFTDMRADVYRTKDALECMIMLDYDVQTLLPYCQGVDFSEHPLCLAHYQSYVLNNSVQDAIESAPVMEKKI